jgi:hypothetical protein
MNGKKERKADLNAERRWSAYPRNESWMTVPSIHTLTRIRARVQTFHSPSRKAYYFLALEQAATWHDSAFPYRTTQ